MVSVHVKFLSYICRRLKTLKFSKPQTRKQWGMHGFRSVRKSNDVANSNLDPKILSDENLNLKKRIKEGFYPRP